ncbi:hypothetical protein ACKUB1_09085 [Methanospirillum stamsii]|uniref:Uncharacterized protein n=1 Tax=Methanospirillum stamsii TaxID=1277351 RepID=A0A2V2N6I5_9EURY|nr:hypothetical protein [Methanospirillum stamsii]PWR75449.1 hypothetical protein DLD82_04780 [Methanospirillum stamsii]
MNDNNILSVLSLLFPRENVVELRALRKSGGIASGYFTDHEKLARDAEVLDSTSDITGIYVTLNEVNPALVSRRANRTDMRLSKDDRTTGDEDIIRRHWFPVDIDPKRPSGISSSDEEHNEALEKAEKIRKFLSELGWPDPVSADSGNGAHLLYLIDLPNDAKATKLIRSCLNVLSAFFSDNHSEIDTAVSNASRIWKLYGTQSRKGDSTPERPHRRSRVLSSPESVKTVSGDLLLRLAALIPDENENNPGNQKIRPDSSQDSRSIDLGSWLAENNISCTEKPYAGGRLFLFDECPFSSAHKDGAYAIQFQNGGIFAGCHHNSCGGGTQRWSELRARLEGKTPRTERDYDNRLKQLARDRAEAKAAYYGNRPMPLEEKNNSENTVGSLKPEHDAYVNPDIIEEAFRVLRDRNPIEYLLESFAADHEGDEVVARCLIMSLASRSVINSNGLHVLVTGESGKGKTHAFDNMLLHIPPEYRLDGRMSDKALFYADDLKAGSAICLDDVTLSDQMQEVLKGVTSAFQKGFVYRTVDKDRKGQKRFIPERCLWWVAKMEGTGDDQVWNRMLTCWIDESPEQDEKVLERELEMAQALPTELEITRREVLVCQQIWEHMTPVHVVIPYAKQIRFSSSANRRNPGMLLDLIKSIAALFQFQREKTVISGRDVVFASIDDFHYASQIYLALNSDSGGQMTKLTRNESGLVDAIRDSGKDELSIEEMQQLTGRSYSSIQKMLHGYASHGNQYSGLLEKCPALSFLERTRTYDGGITSRRVRVYAWNPEIYALWSSGGGCWLLGQDDGSDKKDGDGTDGTGTDGTNDDTRRNGGTRRHEAEDFRRENLTETVVDSLNTNNSTNNFLDSTSRRKDLGSQEEPPASSSCITDPAISADTLLPVQSGCDSALVLKTNTENPSRKNPPGSAMSGNVPPGDIDPSQFHQFRGLWTGPCAVCGSKIVQYTERVTKKMKQEGRDPRKICQKCYSTAVAKKSRIFSTLPGLLNISSMAKAEKDYGRCSVCGLGEVTWYDHETKTGICDVCYARESKERDEGMRIEQEKI